MTTVAKQTSPKRRLLLASDRSDQSSELARILRSVGEVDTVATSEIPLAPGGERADGSQPLADGRLSRHAAAVRSRRSASPRLDAGLGAGRDRHDRASVRRRVAAAAYPCGVSGQ